MKRKFRTITFIALLFSCFLWTSSIYAQDKEIKDLLPSEMKTADKDKPFKLLGNFGYMRVGNSDYFGLRIQPEISFLKFGIGLDIPVYVNLTKLPGKWDLYTDEFKGGVGALRLISYARWGVRKADPFFIRVGMLDNTTVGYGLLVENYTNSISFDQKKFGLNFDILVKNFIGLEGLYSDFNAASFNLMAIRPYIKIGRAHV